MLSAEQQTPDRNLNDNLDTFEAIPDAVPVVFTEPPIEDQLAWHTLWPESHKLYGHGNELFALCSDHDGTLVASSCKVYGVTVLLLYIYVNLDILIKFLRKNPFRKREHLTGG